MTCLGQTGPHSLVYSHTSNGNPRDPGSLLPTVQAFDSERRLCGGALTRGIVRHLILRVCSPASTLARADPLRGPKALTLARRTPHNGLLSDDGESYVRPLHQRDTLVQKLVDVSREAYPSESVKYLSLERLDFRRAIGSTQHPQHHRDLIRREFVEFSRTTLPDNDAGALRTPQDELSLALKIEWVRCNHITASYRSGTGSVQRVPRRRGQSLAPRRAIDQAVRTDRHDRPFMPDDFLQQAGELSLARNSWVRYGIGR